MIKSRKKRRQAQTYWGVLIVNDNTCPVCGNRLINKFQEYWIYGTYEKPATTTYLKSLHCTMCNLSFVGESEMAANNLNYVRGFRGKRIQGKIGLAEARRFAYTPYLKYKKCSFKHGVTVKSRKTQYDTDSLFEFIFNNSKDFDLTFFAANDLRNLLKRYVGNMEYRNCREETDVLNAWENILTRYLPFGQTYAINPEQLGVLIGLLYTDDMFSRLAKGGDFFDKLKKYIFSIIEGCYFSLNQSVKEAYGILRKARKSNKTDKIEQIKKWYKEQYIKAMIYENPPLYVNVYSGKLSCVVHNHKIEERTGYVKRIPDFHPIPVSLHYCHNCHEYSMARFYFDELTFSNNILLFDLNENLQVGKFGYGDGGYYSKLAIQSKFNEMGYCVNEKNSPSFSARRVLIASFLESGFTTKAEFTDFLNWLIHFNHNKNNFQKAIEIWKSDINFIFNYDKERQKEVYQELIFVKKKTIDSIWQQTIMD